MGQEFIIKSQQLEDKINQLLPSQGGFQAGVDLSASTQIVPIVDLTESAEGSNLRQDLQTAMTFNTTVFAVTNTTSTIITTTGYWRMTGAMVVETSPGTDQQISVIINDGTSDRTIYNLFGAQAVDGQYLVLDFDKTIKLNAGHSLKVTSTGTAFFNGSVRQVADIDGNLTDP